MHPQMSGLRPEYPLTLTTPTCHWLWDGKAAGVCSFILWHQCPDTHKRVGIRLTVPSPIGPSLSLTTMQINTVCTSQSVQMALLERMCRGIICQLPRILGHGKGISKARAITAKPVCNPEWGGKHRHALWWPVHVFTDSSGIVTLTLINQWESLSAYYRDDIMYGTHMIEASVLFIIFNFINCML